MERAELTRQGPSTHTRAPHRTAPCCAAPRPTRRTTANHQHCQCRQGCATEAEAEPTAAGENIEQRIWSALVARFDGDFDGALSLGEFQALVADLLAHAAATTSNDVAQLLRFLP